MKKRYFSKSDPETVSAKHGSVLAAVVIYTALAAIMAGTALSWAAFDFSAAQGQYRYAQERIEFDSFAAKTAFELYKTSEAAYGEALSAAGGDDEAFSALYGDIFFSKICEKALEYLSPEINISAKSENGAITVEIFKLSSSGNILYSKRFIFSTAIPD